MSLALERKVSGILVAIEMALVWLLRLVCFQLADRVHANLDVCFKRLPETDTMSLLSLLIRRAKQITEPEVFWGEKRKIPDQTGLNLA